jgi:hypothetical protein
VGQELPTIELFQPVFHFPPEPDIMVDIVFDKLLHVFCGIPSGILSDAIKLGLEFRSEVYFHDLSVGNSRTVVKRRVPVAMMEGRAGIF